MRVDKSGHDDLYQRLELPTHEGFPKRPGCESMGFNHRVARAGWWRFRSVGRILQRPN